MNLLDFAAHSVGWGLAAIVEGGALDCLFTGVNPARPLRWYRRASLVAVAIVGSFVVYLLLFGDS